MAAAPDGFFLKGMIYWGESLSRDTLLAKGFYLEIPDMAAASVENYYGLSDQLKNLMASVLPDEQHALQIQWSVDSNYSAELARYDEITQAAIEEGNTSQFGLYCRAYTHAACKQAMEEGKLRRKRLAVFITRRCNTVPQRGFGQPEQISDYLDQQAVTFGNAIDLVRMTFPEAKITVMDDKEHYYFMSQFLQPSRSLVAHRIEERYAGFREDCSILEQCWNSMAVVQDIDGGTAFVMDGYFHSVFVIEKWPEQTYPAIMDSLTSAVARDYSITENIYPVNVPKKIKTLQAEIDRIKGDATKDRAILAAMTTKIKQVDALADGFTRPYRALVVVRVWDRTKEGLITKCAAIKTAIQAMRSCKARQCDHHAQAKNLFMETFPGWTGGNVRQWDLAATSNFLPHLIPASSTFTGHLAAGESICQGAVGNLTGIQSFAGQTPQHAVLVGMTGAGKSVTLIDWLAQSEALFGYTAIVEEGLAYGLYTELLGGKPIILSSDSTYTLNYFDTLGLPLSTGHLSVAAALCVKMIGVSESAAENNSRSAIIGEYVVAMYNYAVTQWRKKLPEGRWSQVVREAMACLDMQQQMGPGNTYTDAFLAFRELRRTNPDGFAEMVSNPTDEEVLAFDKSGDKSGVVRDYAITLFSREDYIRYGLRHSALVDQLRSGSFDYHDEKECQFLATMLSAWCADGGKNGSLFDGVTNVRFDGRITHFELGYIPDSAKELKEAAGFLIAHYVRQHVMTMPRGVKKRLIFEELARFLDIPEGAKIVSESYAQLRKYGCRVVAVFQNYGAIKSEALVRSIFDNSKSFYLMRQQSREALNEIGDMIRLPELSRQVISDYRLPEHLTGAKYSAFTYFGMDVNGYVCGTARVYAPPHLIYVGDSSGKHFDLRMKALRKYDDMFNGVLKECGAIE